MNVLDDQVERVQKRLFDMLLGDSCRDTETIGALKPAPLTIEAIQKLKREFEAKYRDPVPVAIVVQPRFHMIIASTVCQPAEWPDDLKHFPGLPIYTDTIQPEPWKLFYNWDELRAYLGRTKTAPEIADVE